MKWGRKHGDPWGAEAKHATGLRVVPSPFNRHEMIISFTSPLLAAGKDVWHKVYIDSVLFATTKSTKLSAPARPGKRHSVQVLVAGSGEPSYDPRAAVLETIGNRVTVTWRGVGIQWGRSEWGRLWGPPVKEYEIYVDSVLVDTIPDDGSAIFSWTSDELDDDTYTVDVIPVGFSGIKATGSASNITILSWPKSVTALAYTYDKASRKITLTWTDPAGLGGGSKIRVYTESGDLGTTPVPDYSSVHAEVNPAVQTWESAALAADKAHVFGLRAYDGTYEERNTDVVQHLQIDSSDDDVTNAPNAPLDISARTTDSGEVTVKGTCDHRNCDALATAANLYYDNGTGTIDWGTAIDTVALSGEDGLESFEFTKTGLSGGTPYIFGVRLATAGGVEERNAGEFSVTAETTAPPHSPLTATVDTPPNPSPDYGAFRSITQVSPDSEPEGMASGTDMGGLSTDPPRFMVYIGDNSHAFPNYFAGEQFIPMQVEQRMGKSGWTASILLPRPADDAQAGHYNAVTARSVGEYGFGPMDFLAGGSPIKVGSLVRIDIRKRRRNIAEDLTIFKGVVVGWGWNHAAETMELVCRDYTWRMEGTRCRGRLYAFPEDKWILTADLVFNAGGEPDLAVSGYNLGVRSVTSSLYRFCPPFYNRLLSGATTGPTESPDPAVEAGEDYAYWADYWTPGDIVEYIRYVHSESAIASDTPGLKTYEEFMDFWAVDRKRCATLFEVTNPESETPNAPEEARADIMNLSLSDAGLDDMLSKALAFSPGYDWYLDPEGSAEGKERLEIVNLRDPPYIIDELRLSQVDSAIFDDPPDAHDGGLTNNMQGYFNRVFVSGGHRRIEFHVSTDSYSLEAGWTSAMQAAWAAATDKDKRSNKYPDAYLKFRIPVQDFGMETYLADTVGPLAGGDALDDSSEIGQYVRRNRPLLAGLLASDFPDKERVKRNILVERYYGGAWEPIPDGIGAQLLKDEAGFRLGPAARVVGAKYSNGVSGPWSYDPSTGTPHLIRATIVIESDDRISEVFDKSGTEPVREFAVQANRIGYEARRAAYTYDGVPPVTTVHGEGTAVETLVDGSARLAGIAYKKLSALKRKKGITGTIVLAGIRTGFPLGTKINKLVPYPLGSGERKSYWLELLVRAVTYDLTEGGWTTTLHVAPAFTTDLLGLGLFGGGYGPGAPETA